MAHVNRTAGAGTSERSAQVPPIVRGSALLGDRGYVRPPDPNKNRLVRRGAALQILIF
jgi:hypothetical protein